MSDDAYEPMDHIDWDLIDKDHTFEWLVHLCEVFNRGEEPDHYITWPEDYLWNSNHTSIPEEHRQMWLHVAALICRSPGITVSGNDVSVTGRFGTEFKFEMMPDLSDWNEIEHPQGVDCVPEELHHLLKEPRTVVINGERVLSNENYVPETVYLCWECPRGIPTPVGLYSLLLAMLDETKVWEYLLDYIAAECWACHDTGFLHRDQFPSDLTINPSGGLYLCFWCGPDAPEQH